MLDKFTIKKKFSKKDNDQINISDLQELTLTNNIKDINYKLYNNLKNLSSSLYKITKIYNNISFYNKNIPININNVKNVKKNLKRIYKVDIVNKNYNWIK